MKKKLMLLAALTLFTSAFAQNPAPAQPPECQKQFGQSVSLCAQKNSTLPPENRDAANKDCVAKAQADKKACDIGVSECQTNCQTNLNNTVLQCAADYGSEQCGGDASCVLLISQLNNNCIGAAQTALNSCPSDCK